MRNPKDAVLDALDAAKVDAAIYRTGRRLLDMAGADNGLYSCTRERMLALCGTDSENSMRRHLNDLRAAGLIDYSVGDRVYVAFLALLPANSVAYAPANPQQPLTAARPAIFAVRQAGRGHRRLRVDHHAARGGDQIARGDDQIARDGDHIARGDDRSSHTRDGWLVGLDPDPSQSWQLASNNQPNTQTTIHAGASALAQGQPNAQRDTQTDTQDDKQPDAQPNAEPNAEPDAAEQERSYVLLTDPDVGVASFRARQLAAKHPFKSLLAQVCSFRRDLGRGSVHSTGALVRRIENGFPGVLTDADRDTPLWRRHVSEEEEAAWEVEDEAEQRRRKYDAGRWLGN